MSREPKDCIELYRNNVRVSDSILLDIIIDVARYGSKLHRTQLLQIRSAFRDNGHISRSQFSMLGSLFKRYKDKFVEELGKLDKTNVIEQITAGLAEWEKFTKYMEELSGTNKASMDSNFTVRRREELNASNQVPNV